MTAYWLTPSIAGVAAVCAALSGAGQAEGEEAVWWSLRPLAAAEVPEVSSAWPRTDVDRFVWRKLVEQGLQPSPAADRRSLIRRLSFDLHGLPPQPEEISRFVEDPSPEAYPALVDRLLASPRYGERWGRHWLDVVHYGDTHGYDKDKPRPHAWPYRDYVIRAFNDDLAFPRFVEQQVAGDVLDPDHPDGIIATGFIAAGPWDFVGHVELREGTVDKEITRSLDRDDMVATTMSTFSAMTVHCARCHDHKFDPVSQRDYYRLQAVFAGVDRADREIDADPEVHRARRALGAEQRVLDVRRARDLAELNERREHPTSDSLRELQQALRRAEKDVRPWEDRLLDTQQASNNLGWHSAIENSSANAKWVEVDLGEVAELDALVLIPSFVRYGGHGPGFGFPRRFRVEVSRDSDFSAPITLADHTQADVDLPLGQPYFLSCDRIPARVVRITATSLFERTDDWIFALAELVVLSGGRNVARGAEVRSLDSIEAPPSWSRVNLTDGRESRHPLALDALARDEGGLLDALRCAESVESVHRVESLTREFELALVGSMPEDWRTDQDHTEQRLAAIEQELAALPAPAKVFAASREFKAEGSFSAAAEPRPVHLLDRGDVRRPGELMQAGALSCFADLERHFDHADLRDEGQRRAALARWITDRDNPLTWRVIVNRVWHYHFGKGLVATPNDFGRMGSPPSHPELLDWLALRFRGRPSFKDLHRLIVTSAVYRQSSTSRAAEDVDGSKALAVDPDNLWLWKSPRRRLEAEELRDTVLAISGDLDLTAGGPGVQWFQFTDDHSPRYDYASFDVSSEASRRRSVYRFVVRSVPDPFMTAFDCADPSTLTPRRNVTLTALQALALLNDPLVVHQAARFAQRLRREVGEDLPAAVQRAFEYALGRPPTDAETRRTQDYARAHGLENLCRVIFNLNEFYLVD